MSSDLNKLVDAADRMAVELNSIIDSAQKEVIKREIINTHNEIFNSINQITDRPLNENEKQLLIKIFATQKDSNYLRKLRHLSKINDTIQRDIGLCTDIATNIFIKHTLDTKPDIEENKLTANLPNSLKTNPEFLFKCKTACGYWFKISDILYDALNYNSIYYNNNQKTILKIIAPILDGEATVKSANGTHIPLPVAYVDSDRKLLKSGKGQIKMPGNKPLTEKQKIEQLKIISEKYISDLLLHRQITGQDIKIPDMNKVLYDLCKSLGFTEKAIQTIHKNMPRIINSGGRNYTIKQPTILTGSGIDTFFEYCVNDLHEEETKRPINLSVIKKANEDQSTQL